MTFFALIPHGVLGLEPGFCEVRPGFCGCHGAPMTALEYLVGEPEDLRVVRLVCGQVGRDDVVLAHVYAVREALPELAEVAGLVVRVVAVLGTLFRMVEVGRAA
jgi:hypothetical protein